MKQLKYTIKILLDNKDARINDALIITDFVL